MTGVQTCALPICTARAGASGEAVSLVCADEVNLLGAIEVLIGQPLSRIEQHGFEPDHRVPETGPAGQVIKKPKKPKMPKHLDYGIGSGPSRAKKGSGGGGGRRGGRSR